jgi:PAS domain S-box-containing protein
MHLLHLEDSTADAELIAILIHREWPDCTIRHVANVTEYRAALHDGGFDLILSDYTLPGFDGLSALALARSHAPAVPFLFLSGTIGEERAVEALKRGATDYVLKDRPTRLIPAVRQSFALLQEAKRRRRTEEAMRQNQERFRQITENVTELISVVDLEGRRMYANAAHRDLFGDPARLVGTDPFEDIHHEDRQRVRAAFVHTVRTGEYHACDFRLVLPDGRTRHVEANSSILRNAAGLPGSVLLVWHDATARHEAQARLREQATLLDRARDAVIATDLELRVSYWNASAERLYGWSALEAVGQQLDRLGLGFEPSRFAAAQAELLAQGEWRGDFRLRTRSGEPVLVESTWSLVVDNDGRPRSILFIDTDVTEKKKLEAQLLRAQRMDSIGTLAGGIAHDLNNMLTPVLLSIDMLAAKVDAEEDRRLIEKIRASASHGAALVQQLLAFARGAEGKRTNLDPARALAEVEQLVRQSLPATIEVALDCSTKPWLIHADRTQFNQAMINLCINARDAMPDGGRIEISTRNLEIEAGVARANPGVRPGKFVRVSVADSGTGIPATLAEKIFDPFFTTKAAGKGTGLGLPMVAGVLKTHGGFVQFETEEGRGTTFHLYFPAVPTLTPAEPPASPRPFSQGAGEGILLIDDEPFVRDTLQLLLERAGYRVYSAEDGRSGIAAFDRHARDVSLVITDMMLPDQIGTAVVRQLRERDPLLPIVAISGMMASGQFDELLQLTPPVQCLSKPLLPATLLDAVRRGLPVKAVART